MITITISNLKGGVLKTTSSLFLGDILSRRGDTILIDTDPQANLTNFYNLPLNKFKKNNIMSAMQSGMASKAVYSVYTGLYLLPATLQMADVESVFSDAYGKELLLKTAITALPYSYAIIDTPPALGIITRNALFACNKLVIPVDPHIWSIEAALKLLKNIDAIQASPLRSSVNLTDIYILPVKNKNFLAKYEKEFLKSLKTHFGGFKILTAISHDDEIKKKQSQGQLPRGRVYNEYMQIARELLDEGN